MKRNNEVNDEMKEWWKEIIKMNKNHPFLFTAFVQYDAIGKTLLCEMKSDHLV